MTYPEAIQYLESFINYEKISVYPYKESLKLERIKDFLEIIGNPQSSLRSIHIAGTKGKGSTCAFIAYILRQAGFKVGLYTSPHLSDFRERIRILVLDLHQVQDDFERMIAKNALADLVARLKPAVEKYNRTSQYGPLSFFEVYTTLAFLYFQEEKVDFAVLETGLGGRLDATNVVEPLVCALTPISYEHTQKLGNTLREIAAEKAGIIKSKKLKEKRQKLIVITAPQEKEALEAIKDKCRETGARLVEVGRDIAYPDLKIKLIGRHQLINANVAIAAIKALSSYGIQISHEAIKDGLSNTRWPGRCEVISRNPTVVLDGAQNVSSVCVLKEAVKENFPYRRLILILGISSDKDIKGICNEFSNLADRIILTKANNPRATAPEILRQYFNAKTIEMTDNIRDAKTAAYRSAKKDDLILVTGSLFVVGEFRNDQA